MVRSLTKGIGIFHDIQNKRYYQVSEKERYYPIILTKKITEKHIELLSHSVIYELTKCQHECFKKEKSQIGLNQTVPVKQ
jgi:hypothetical protein